MLADFVFSVEMWFHHFGRAGLKLLTSGDPLTSASQRAGITGVSHGARPWSSILEARGCPSSFQIIVTLGWSESCLLHFLVASAKIQNGFSRVRAAGSVKGTYWWNSKNDWILHSLWTRVWRWIMCRVITEFVVQDERILRMNGSAVKNDTKYNRVPWDCLSVLPTCAWSF